MKRWVRTKGEKIWWLVDDEENTFGNAIFSFDKKKEYRIFGRERFPWDLTPEQQEIFKKENPTMYRLSL
jgi:hypothetical protein